MALKPGPSRPNRKPSNPSNSYLRYSSLAFQLLITIGVCGWLGYKADHYFGNKYPVLMLLLGFLGFGGSLYQIYRSINRPSQLVWFLVSAAALTLGLPPVVLWFFNNGSIQSVPTFLYESTWLVAFMTVVIFIYLYRVAKPAAFVQLYLLSMAVKLLACFSYSLLMISEDRSGGAANVLYFLATYILFTALEIGFLYRKISNS